MGKSVLLTLLLYFFLCNSCSSVAAPESNSIQSEKQGIDFNTFHVLLSPHGQWIDYPPYGFVWVCSIPGFRPYYSDGYWIYADGAWTWVSLYDWGWAPFHYGRWKFVSIYGWIWVPAYDWAPAWVCWRRGPVYYGWAPLEPGITINYIITNGYACPDDYWTFVPHHHITQRDFTPYVVTPRVDPKIISNSPIINNPGVYRKNIIERGPDRKEVENHTQKPVEQHKVREYRKPEPTRVDKGKLRTYRPEKKPEARPKTPEKKQTPQPEKKQPPKKQQRGS